MRARDPGMSSFIQRISSKTATRIEARGGLVCQYNFFEFMNIYTVKSPIKAAAELSLYKPRPSCGYYSRAAFMYTYRIESIDTVTDAHLQ